VSYEAIAGRYAQALYDIGVETGTLGKLAEEVTSFADTYLGSEELQAVLDNPLVSEHDRDALLDEVARRLGLSLTVSNTLRLLIRRRRLVVISAVGRALRKMSDEKDGVVRATVVSAKALPEPYAQRLQTELQKLTGKKVLLTREVDASLIAGVVTRVGDTVIDGSLRTRLDGLRSQLLAD
jgi:F-type H+-transporting ATPase subunit delta